MYGLRATAFKDQPTLRAKRPIDQRVVTSPRLCGRAAACARFSAPSLYEDALDVRGFTRGGIDAGRKVLQFLAGQRRQRRAACKAGATGGSAPEYYKNALFAERRVSG
jgi:hypothetical protein